MASVQTSYDQVETALEQFRGDPPATTQSLNPQIRDVLTCIHRDPFEPKLDVQTIRERCRVRDHNISSRFRFSLGVTIKEYIEEIRMRAACYLLAKHSIGIFDIALLVGYSHPQTFYRAFGRSVGCTPAAFRRRNKNFPTCQENNKT